MVINRVQKRLLELIGQFGAIRVDQAEALLRQQFPYIEIERTLFPLKSGGKLTQREGYLFGSNSRIHPPTVEAIDILLLVEPDATEPYLKGADPFALTFFKKRDNKLWRYDICPVAKGTEYVVCAQLENVNPKYRMILFVLGDKEQMALLHVNCEHRFVLKSGGTYHFYK